jgi:hypothetical protein
MLVLALLSAVRGVATMEDSFEEPPSDEGPTAGTISDAVPAAVSVPRKIPFVAAEKAYEFQAVVRLRHEGNNQQGQLTLPMKQLREDIIRRFAVPDGYTPIIEGMTFVSANSSVVTRDEARESLSVALKDIGDVVSR